MFGTLGFWQKEDVAPLRGEGNSATPAQSTIVTNVDYHCQHRWDYLKTIKKEATTKELVGDNKLDENNGKVEELAEDEAVEVDVVPEQHCCHCQQWSVLWASISWSSWAHLCYILQKMHQLVLWSLWAHLLWMFLQKYLTSRSLFSSWSSTNLIF